MSKPLEIKEYSKVISVVNGKYTCPRCGALLEWIKEPEWDMGFGADCECGGNYYISLDGEVNDYTEEE